jgi:hypothetical protein
VDSGWVQVALAGVAIIVGIGIFWFERHNKSLAYTITVSRSLVTKTKAFPDLDVFYDGAPVEAPWLVVWRVANGGATAVEASQVEEPLRLWVEPSRILSAAITHTRPAAFSPSIEEIDSHNITLDRRLINPNDMFEVQMLLDGQPDTYDVRARIAGVSEISRARVQQTPWGTPYKYGLSDWIANLVATASIGGIGLALVLAGSVVWSPFAGVVCLFAALVLIPWFIWRKNRIAVLFLG